jgi:UDP-GlcNAc:undecaprenyl-phosphate GlcNAc-1-phosphate transferase
LVFFAVFTLKATRRREGFKLSPLDFIILFVAVLVPNLPDPAIRHFHLGLLAVKIIVIFFVFEVLIGELRGQLKRLGGGVVVALTVLVAKSFLA